MTVGICLLYRLTIESAVWMACQSCGMSRIKSASKTTSAHRSRRAVVALPGLCKRNRIELSPNLATNSKSFCFLILGRFMNLP